MTTLREAITSGGDERIEYQSNGLNKYLVDPAQSDGVFNRGSCTCSTLSPEARPKVSALFDRLKAGADIDEVRHQQRRRMKRPLGLGGATGFDIFFAPSGSDLCFYPLLFTHLRHPDKPLINIVTCPEELGTGSILANRGLYFSTKTQLVPVEKGTEVNSNLKLDYLSFPARSKSGDILDHNKEIYNEIEKYRNSHSIIVNLVIGSKSGIEDNLSIIEDGPKDVQYVVDLCQLRATPKLIQHLLSLNCLILITGSKFYQSPPFCGALLVPDEIGNSIKAAEVSSDQIAGFDKIYSRFDVPGTFENIREKLEPFGNIGLTLRWEAAIVESEILLRYTERQITHAVSTWNKHILEHMETKDIFVPMKDQEKTNRSIISFSVKMNGQLLNHEQLKELYEAIVTEGADLMPPFKKITIGQPVAYEAHSFIRLALGSTNVRQLIDSGLDLTDDIRLIETIETLALKLNAEVPISK